VRYEWDEEKNRRNQRKHGVSFELGALALDDPLCLVAPDRIDHLTGEQRWIGLGSAQPATGSRLVLVVSHVYRKDSYGQEIIRIFSARPAQKRDLRRYQAQALE